MIDAGTDSDVAPWPWPLTYDRDLWTWPRYLLTWPPCQNASPYISPFSFYSETDTHTDRHTHTHTMPKLLHPTRLRDVGCNKGSVSAVRWSLLNPNVLLLASPRLALEALMDYTVYAEKGSAATPLKLIFARNPTLNTLRLSLNFDEAQLKLKLN